MLCYDAMFKRVLSAEASNRALKHAKHVFFSRVYEQMFIFLFYNYSYINFESESPELQKKITLYYILL